MKRSKALSLLLAGSLLLAAITFTLRPEAEAPRAQLVSAAGPAGNPGDPADFSRAEKLRSFRFPEDHGPHPDYQTEWWYYTGNLATAGGRQFGYQLTFFRRAILPMKELPDRASAWATGQVYMAHFALIDIGGERFNAFERLSRGAAGLAGAQADPYQVWLENWSVVETGPDRYRLAASQEGLALDLLLTDLKGPVLQGDQGYSRKGPEPGNASYYYSLTRLESTGQVQVGPDRYEVSGLSWMDHEWSTSALSEGQTGWDWFSIQMDDGSELMVFQIRREDGSIDAFSSGTLILPDGKSVQLSSDDFQIEALATWRSPRSEATYPARWQVRVPAQGLALEATPRLADQELSVSYDYWEGAVQVVGERGGKAVAGSGYVELTGYAKPMTGEF
jgi:predicted secreted hydrolase